MDLLTFTRLKRLIFLSAVQTVDEQSTKTFTLDADWVYPSGVTSLVLAPILFFRWVPLSSLSFGVPALSGMLSSSEVMALCLLGFCWYTRQRACTGCHLQLFHLCFVLIAIFINGSRLQNLLGASNCLPVFVPTVNIYCLNLNPCRICTLGKSASP